NAGRRGASARPVVLPRPRAGRTASPAPFGRAATDGPTRRRRCGSVSHAVADMELARPTVLHGDAAATGPRAAASPTAPQPRAVQAEGLAVLSHRPLIRPAVSSHPPVLSWGQRQAGTVACR